MSIPNHNPKTITFHRHYDLLIDENLFHQYNGIGKSFQLTFSSRVVVFS